MATSWQLFVNMLAASFGTGILSMPWSAAGASVVPAVGIMLLVAMLMAFTISVLVDASENMCTYDLASLLSLLPGRSARVMPLIVNLALWASLWLVLVGYVITIKDALQPFVDTPLLRTIVPSVVILPLCFLDLGRLAITSSLSLVATINLVAIVLSRFADERRALLLPADVCWCGIGSGITSMFSMSCTSMIIQMCALPMYVDLDDRSPQKFKRVVWYAFTVLFVVYACFSVVGYLTVGPRVQQNILKDLPAGPWGTATRLSYIVVIAAVYPMFVYPMIHSVRRSDVLRSRGANVELLGNVATVAIVMTAMIAGSLLDDLGFLNVLIGAGQCIVFVGLCPGLAGIYLLRRGSEGQSWKNLMIAMIAFCFVAGCLGLVYTDNYVDDLSKSCFWGGARHTVTLTLEGMARQSVLT